MVWAASMASRIERTVHSMLLTTPFRRPRQGTLPTPRMVMPSASTSPTTAETLVVPRSSPTTISLPASGVFMAASWSTRSGDSGRGRLDAAMHAVQWPSSGRTKSRRSFHPDDHALGMRLIVGEHDPGHAPESTCFTHHALGHREPLVEIGATEAEGDRFFADRQTDPTATVHVHLLGGIRAGHGEPRVLCEDLEAALEPLELPAPIPRDPLGGNAGDHRQIDGVLAIELFERRALAIDDVELPRDGRERDGLTLFELHVQAARQLADDARGRDPRIVEQLALDFGGL